MSNISGAHDTTLATEVIPLAREVAVRPLQPSLAKGPLRFAVDRPLVSLHLIRSRGVANIHPFRPAFQVTLVIFITGLQTDSHQPIQRTVFPELSVQDQSLYGDRNLRKPLLQSGL